MTHLEMSDGVALLGVDEAGEEHGVPGINLHFHPLILSTVRPVVRIIKIVWSCIELL